MPHWGEKRRLHPSPLSLSGDTIAKTATFRQGSTARQRSRKGPSKVLEMAIHAPLLDSMHAVSEPAWFLICLAVIGFAGGYIYGANVAAGAYLDDVAERFKLSDEGVELVSSAATITDAIAMLVLGSVVLDRFGRRNLVALGGLCNILGALLGACATEYETLLAARCVLGLGNGVSILTVPMLVAESSPMKQRGFLVSFFQVGVVIGFTAPYLIQLSFKNWKVTLGSGGIPGVVLLVVLAAVWQRAESKSWLASREQGDYDAVPVRESSEHHSTTLDRYGYNDNDTEDSEAVIWDGDRQIHNRNSSSVEVESGQRAFASDDSENNFEDDEATKYEGRFGFYQRCLIAILLAFTNNSSDAIIFYGPQIIQDAGIGSENSLWTALAISAVNIPAVILVLVVIKSLPRRTMLLWGLAVVVLAYIVVGVTFTSSLSNMHVIVVAGLLAIMIAYQAGPGTMFLVVLPELFAQSDRATGMSVGTVSMSVFSIICNGTMLSTIHAFGPGPTFLFYAVLYIISLAILVRHLPESKHVHIIH
mmetsp:Transcript_938/g.2201  ORF Transcript_938/g.2201 Transcript_938/m.2201 type:complete len:533 (+) Transcript_938:144-1742(+)